MKISILVIALILGLNVSCDKAFENQHLTGPVFGTSYSIIYDSNENFQSQLDSLFEVINHSMSTYHTNSIISQVNRNDSTEIDFHFMEVLKASRDIYKQTEGVFDPTIGVLVNAWNFGPEGGIHTVDSIYIDSLKPFVGLDKVILNTSSNTISKPKITYLDFNAIAKGYAVDVVGEFLESKGSQNYLVEIGGEIRTKGTNKESGKPWKVGVEEPHFDGSRSILKAITLTDESMATSGTYRKFKVDSLGNRYSHIIDPKTGYPSTTNLLSISVITSSCMYADGYATAFKAMGIDKVKDFVKDHPELKVFLIFENSNKEFETLSLNGFPSE